MTKEDAIKILNEWAECNYAPTRDAACLAISALRAQAEAEKCETPAGWISVKEPPDLGGGFYLVWTRNTGVEKCRWSEKHKRWMGGRWTEQITHWMPMPKPPEPVAP